MILKSARSRRAHFGAAGGTLTGGLYNFEHSPRMMDVRGRPSTVTLIGDCDSSAGHRLHRVLTVRRAAPRLAEETSEFITKT